MDQLEKNVMYSFRLVKSDVVKLQQDVHILTQNQQRLFRLIEELKAENTDLKVLVRELSKKKVVAKQPVKKVVKKVVKKKSASVRKKSRFVASKTGNKFHVPNCPFAKNIKPKMKVKFASKIKALNEGLKPCTCVNK